jgi:hypothetical protein
MDTDLNNLNLSAYAMSGAVRSSGYDQRKGDELKHNSPTLAEGSDLMNLSLRGGDSVFAKQTNGISIPHLTARELHTSVNELRQKSLAAATVYISAHKLLQRHPAWQPDQCERYQRRIGRRLCYHRDPSFLLLE